GLITQGLDAYLAGDHLKAISVLVPQIENALRRLLRLLGQAPNKPRRGDATIMTEKSLNEILEREPAVADFLGEDIRLYILTFLADARGHNLRNRMSHGLMTAPRVQQGMQRPRAPRPPAAGQHPSDPTTAHPRGAGDRVSGPLSCRRLAGRWPG